jgi:hypothetical protein
MGSERPCILLAMAGPSYDRPCEGRRALQIECRRCAVICERVVYPTHCLRSGCRYVYAFDHGDATFFGCVEKVFTVELDLAPYRPGSSRDVYGALKSQKPPRPECRVEIEQAYGMYYSRRECRNPLFVHDPDEYSPDAIRRLVNGQGPSCAGDPPACAPADGDPADAVD